jgi:purine catabolism regulator
MMIMLSIVQALQMEVFSQATVVAGRGGLNKTIQWAHVVDLPEVAEWVREGVLLFTTAFGLKDRPDLQNTLISELARLGVAGMVVAVGRYFHDIPARMIEQADEFDFPIVTLPWKVPFIEVMRAISEYLVQERYALMQQSIAVHNVLTQVVLGGANLDELARKLASLVQCPVLIDDPSFRVLTHAAFGEVDQAREDSILLRETPPALMAELVQQGIIAKIQQSQHPVHLPPIPDHGMIFERIVAPIIAGGERLGYVWLIAHNRLTGEMDMITMEHAATVAALIVLRDRAVYETEQRLKSSLLEELLHSPVPLRADLSEGVHSLGLGSRNQVLILRPREPQPNRLTPLSRLAEEQMRLARRRGSVIERASCLVLLAQSDRTQHGLELANAIWTASQQQNYALSIGVGQATENLNALSTSYAQALEALDTGMVFQSKEGGVISFDDLGILHWLRHLPDEIRKQNVFYQAIGLLVQHDAEHHTNLISTLEVYLETGSNAQKAAERLYLHRNTLSQRLSKIESLAHLNLRDPNVLLNLNIALKDWRLRATP